MFQISFPYIIRFSQLRFTKFKITKKILCTNLTQLYLLTNPPQIAKIFQIYSNYMQYLQKKGSVPMNPLKKAYCRTFQTGLKIALPFLPYRKPKITGSVKSLPEVIRKKKCTKALIITDAGIRKLGLTRRLEKALTANGIPYCIYDKTVANPTTVNVSEAIELYQENECDCIIGFGGGSSMDCAKAVGARLVRPKKSLAKMKGILKVRRRLPLLMTIPTTAGTGSETTLAAVITDAETRHKYAINDFPLIPRYAVLDPKVTLSLPPFITATTGMDALTHAVEAYIGNSTTYGTRKDALLALKLIFENIDTAYMDGSNVEARRNMLHASFYAGSCLHQVLCGICARHRPFPWRRIQRAPRPCERGDPSHDPGGIWENHSQEAGAPGP